MSTSRVGIYARISKDDLGDELAVTRQIKDCTELAVKKNWAIASVYKDEAVSATRSKVRPDYQRLLTDIRAKRIDKLVVWDIDRLTRTPRETEDLIDLADEFGLELASVGGEVDLSRPQGRMILRIKSSVARNETDQMSRRLKRKFLERAEAGLPGTVAYGWRRVVVRDDKDRKISSHDEIDEEQAAVLRSVKDALLSGQTLRSIAAELNAKGVPSARGVRWAETPLRLVMIRPRNAGFRLHQGRVLPDVKGQWDVLWDEDTHDRLVAILTAPDRRTNLGSTRRHLLSGLARCGRCEVGLMRVVNAGEKSKPDAAGYDCRECHGVRRKQSAVDHLVEEVMIEFLSDPEALKTLSSGDPDEMERASAELAVCEAKLALATDAFVDSDDDDAFVMLTRIKAKLRPRIEAARATIRASLPANVPMDIAGPDARANWEAAPLDIKRELIGLVWDIKIMPSGTGKRFDPELIKFTRKARPSN